MTGGVGGRVAEPCGGGGVRWKMVNSRAVWVWV